MGIQVGAGQVAAPFYGQVRGYNRGHLGYLKIFLSQTSGPKYIDI